MTELYFMRHGQRIDHALEIDPSAKAIYEDYKPYDPSLSIGAINQIDDCCNDITNSTEAFVTDNPDEKFRKNVFIHFSPYLRCCQTADLLITNLKEKFEKKFPNYKIRFQLLGDFALSEWIHDKMKNKPPFVDSNDAYQMYTPNIKLLKNRSACSNFRPCVTLGHYNGYDLSYKDYQDNCKEYFKRLLATYDKPTYINNQDIVIIVSHGYLINNVLSYFVNHPIFDEIPEAKINYARRIKQDGDENEEHATGENEDNTQNEQKYNYNWVLIKDALEMFNFNHIDTSLNLETDIVYYKTNFIKRDELNPDKSVVKTKKEDKPRPSFKIPHTSQSYQMAYSESLHLDLDSKETNPNLNSTTIKSTKDNYKNPNIIDNPICPAAKGWSAQKINAFKVKNEFKLKVMNSEAFKQNFDITRLPIKPVTPEVSPCSEPTRNNSVIDLSKMLDNKDSRPMKLRYSNTAEIPLHHLNQKVNSQVNLAQFQRSNPSSNNSSITDFPKFMSYTKRGVSNPVVIPKDSKLSEGFFQSNSNPNSVTSPKLLTSTLSNDSLYEDMDLTKLDSNDLAIIKELSTHTNGKKTPPPNPLLSRSKSAKYKQELAMNSGKSLLAMYQKHQANNNSGSDGEHEDERFSLSFHNKPTDKKVQTSPSTLRRPRKNSIKFYPSVMNVESQINREGASTPVGFYTSNSNDSTNMGSDHQNNDNEKQTDSSSKTKLTQSYSSRPPLVQTKSKSMFYNLDSDSDSNELIDSSDEEVKPPDNNRAEKYTWFGGNK